MWLPVNQTGPSGPWPVPTQRPATSSPSDSGPTSTLKLKSENMFRVCSMICASAAGPCTSRPGQ